MRPHPIDPSWIPIRNQVGIPFDFHGFPLAAAEVLSAPIALTENNANRARAVGIELSCRLFGAGVGSINLTLKTYRCPGADFDYRDLEPFATRTVTSSGGTAPGVELIADGGFAVDVDYAGGWEVAGGVLAHVATNVPDRARIPTGAITKNVWYSTLVDIVAAPVPGKLTIAERGQPLEGLTEIDFATLPTRLARLFKAPATANPGGLDFVTAGALTLDNLSLKSSVPFAFGTVVTVDDIGSGVVFGFLPAADMTSATFLEAKYRRWCLT